MKTLVIQPLPGIGDMVWHLAPLHGLAQQFGPLAVMTKRRSLAAQLLADDPAVDKVQWLERDGRHHGIRGLGRLIGDIRAQAFDQAWIFHHSARYALACRLAGVPARFGYGSKRQKPFLNQAMIPRGELHGHPVSKARALLAVNGIPVNEVEPRLFVADERLVQAREELQSAAKPLIMIGIGSSEPNKQWGGARFVELLHQFAARGFGAMLVGGPGEQRLADDICCSLDDNTQEPGLLIGRPLDELAGLLACADLYVGNDTGMLNVSAAVSVPSIGLFGASPVLTHSRHLHAVKPAHPREGMAGISVDTVMQKVSELLDG